MKTIPRNRSTLFSAFFLIGGLAALYFYRKQGGQVRSLISRGTDLYRTASEKINAIAPETTGVTSRSRAHEVPMTPEDMDRFPAT